MCLCGGGNEEMELLERDMKRLFLIPLTLLLLGAAPSRTKTYTAGQVISPTDVTENEDNIFAYLQAGVDTLRTNSVLTGNITDGTILNVDISSSAAIAYSKLNLSNSVVGADIVNNTINGTKIAIGSDAQGDVLYYDGTDWARLVAGTSGNFLKTNGAGFNPSWAAISSLSSKVGEFTRDTTVASGTQAVTGVGFTPVAVILFSAQPTSNEVSWGLSTASADSGVRTEFALSADTFSSMNTSSISAIEGVGTNYQGQISSFDADGFTVTWTRTGTPSGTLEIEYLALK